MRHLVLMAILFVGSIAYGQIHNRLIKLNVGFSSEQVDIKQDIRKYNDTSAQKFEFVSRSPILSYSHEFLIGDVLSISGKVGGQYLNIFFDNQHYGSPFVFASINPALSVVYRNNFEYYIKLQLGVNYWFNQPELLPSVTKRIFPEKINVFTGVTNGGFNYYVSDKMGLNLELSIWSPELLTFGVSYRFFQGEIPNIQQLQDL